MANNWIFLLLISQYSCLHRVFYSCVLTTTITGGVGPSAPTVLRQIAIEANVLQFQQLLYDFGTGLSKVVLKSIMGSSSNSSRDPMDIGKKTNNNSLSTILQELALGVQLHNEMGKITTHSVLWRDVSVWLQQLCTVYTVNKAKLREFLLSISATLIRYALLSYISCVYIYTNLVLA